MTLGTCIIMEVKKGDYFKFMRLFTIGRQLKFGLKICGDRFKPLCKVAGKIRL